MEYVWRPITPDDAGDWAGLLADMTAVDHGWEYFTAEDLREDFDDPAADFPRGSIAVYDGAKMIAYATLTSRSAGDETRLRAGVHPDHRRRGLGGRLLDWAEPVAEALHPGRRLTAECLAADEGAVALYAARGYRPSRWFHAMTCDLTIARPERAVPDGVEIVGFGPDRIEESRAIRNEALRDHWGSSEASAEEWAHFMGSGVWRPELSFLAEAGGEPVALIIGHEYGAYAAATGVRDLYIALVATCRAARRRGIASALLGHALAEARAAGFTAASLGVDADSLTGAVGIYERAGFIVDHTTITQTKPSRG